MDDGWLLGGGRLRSPLRRLPVRSLARLTIRLLRRVLTRLLTVWTLLSRIGRLRLASRGRLPVLLWLSVRPGLLLPVRIRRILPVRRLLPVTAHAHKISA
jgi:hypothetical protein